jgi:hypothetical protein
MTLQTLADTLGIPVEDLDLDLAFEALQEAEEDARVAASATFIVVGETAIFDDGSTANLAALDWRPDGVAL